MSNDPFQSPQYPGQQPPTGYGQAPPSGAVTAVAIVNFIFGGLAAICGAVMLVGGGAIANAIMGAGNDPNLNMEGAGVAAGALGGFVMVIALIVLLVAALYIFAGVGVIKRRQYGRILCFVLAGLHILSLVLNLAQGNINILSILISGGYIALVFAVLLNRQYAAEFA